MAVLNFCDIQEPQPQPRVSAIREGAFDVPHVIRKRYKPLTLVIP